MLWLLADHLRVNTIQGQHLLQCNYDCNVIMIAMTTIQKPVKFIVDYL